MPKKNTTKTHTIRRLTFYRRGFTNSARAFTPQILATAVAKSAEDNAACRKDTPLRQIAVERTIWQETVKGWNSFAPAQQASQTTKPTNSFWDFISPELSRCIVRGHSFNLKPWRCRPSFQRTSLLFLLARKWESDVFLNTSISTD